MIITLYSDVGVWRESRTINAPDELLEFVREERRRGSWADHFGLNKNGNVLMMFSHCPPLPDDDALDRLVAQLYVAAVADVHELIPEKESLGVPNDKHPVLLAAFTNRGEGKGYENVWVEAGSALELFDHLLNWKRQDDWAALAVVGKVIAFPTWVDASHGHKVAIDQDRLHDLEYVEELVCRLWELIERQGAAQSGGDGQGQLT